MVQMHHNLLNHLLNEVYIYAVYIVWILQKKFLCAFMTDFYVNIGFHFPLVKCLVL